MGASHAGRGQASVEGAFLIPVILLLLMLLIQPGILLYDRMVMNAAAAEGCRLLAGRSASGGVDDAAYEEYVRRRLAAIPEHDCFHVHESGCSWVIRLSGDESSQTVSVYIENQVKPLPFIDFASRALGAVGQSGTLSQSVEVTQTLRSDWVAANEQGLDPRSWVVREGEEG